MRLLFVSYAYPPLRYPRAIQVARLAAHLTEQEIVVVCADEPGTGDASLLNLYPDGRHQVVRVAWSRASLTARTIRLKILEDRLLVPDTFRPWQRDAARAIRRHGLLANVDALVTFGQPMSDHLLGLRFARQRDLPWIAHFSDPWVDSPFQSGAGVTRRLNERLERHVFERADALVFTSEETVELVRARHGKLIERKAHVLPHSFDPAVNPAVSREEDGLVVRYVGNFYGHRGPQPLFDALRLLHRTRPEALAGVRVELIGQSERPLVPEEAAELPSGLVVMRDPVDYVESLALMRSSDLLLVLDAPGSQSVFLPSKLVEYLGANRPILALTPPGATAALVRRTGGWQADPSDTHACAEALAEALASVCASRADMSYAAGLSEEYSAPAVAARFAAIVAAVNSRDSELARAGGTD